LGSSAVKYFRERKEKSMSNWLKAGLIGGGVVVLLDIVGLIPCVGCFTCLLGLAAYGCIGALAAYWMPPVRAAGPAAGQGALAGLIAGAISGVVGIFLSAIQATVLAPLQLSFLGQLPPEVVREMQAAGLDPNMLLGGATDLTGALGTGVVCCGVGLAIAAGLGALGGLIFAAMRPGEPGGGPV
jgi:hypothetical protein